MNNIPRASQDLMAKFSNNLLSILEDVERGDAMIPTSSFTPAPDNVTKKDNAYS